MKTIEEVWSAIAVAAPKKVAVACAADSEVLHAVNLALQKKIANFILVGDEARIAAIADQQGYDLSKCEIINQVDEAQAAMCAVKLVSEGKADVIMKGLMESSTFLKAVLNKEVGIRKPGSVISAIAVMQAENRLVFITDPGFTPLPDLETKKALIRNAVSAARKMGVETPKVACICAAESVNPKMISSVEADELQKANESGELQNCQIAGPISLDLALFEEAAKHKHYTNPVAGKADILLVPSLEVGNVLYKSLAFIAHMPTGGIMTGAKAPIIFTSRADSFETKLNTIAFAVYLASREEV